MIYTPRSRNYMSGYFARSKCGSWYVVEDFYLTRGKVVEFLAVQRERDGAKKFPSARLAMIAAKCFGGEWEAVAIDARDDPS